MSTTDNTNAQPSFLDMSDEDIASFDTSKLIAQAEEKEETSDEVIDDTGSKADDTSANTETNKVDESTDNTSDDETSDDTEEKDGDSETTDDSKNVVDTTITNNSDSKSKETKETPAVKQELEDKSGKAESTEIDYKAAYEQIFSPFKANGKNIQISSVEEATALMQMGANYNKKMAALKPNLKLMKLLDNNGLLNEDKLTYLIDLDKKNPEAITKLLKDSGIDPMGIDTEKANAYKPGNYKVDDRELELDAVVEEIKDSPSYSRTLSIVADEWDQASKRAVGETPELLKVINDHVERGIYDMITKEVEHQRMLGRLTGLNDITAYRQVGDAIQARGGFDSLSAKGKVSTPAVVVTPKPKVDDIELKNKKRAASSTKPAASTGVAKDFNPLALSDEEFSKMVNPSLM